MQSNKPNNKRLNIAAFIVFGALIFFIIFILSNSSIETNNGNDKPKVNNSDLILGLRSSSDGIHMVNKEEGELINCEVRVNDKFTRRVPRIGNTEVLIIYPSLTTGSGERFNNLTHKVTSVVIERCSGQEGRIGIYGN